MTAADLFEGTSVERPAIDRFTEPGYRHVFPTQEDEGRSVHDVECCRSSALPVTPRKNDRFDPAPDYFLNGVR